MKIDDLPPNSLVLVLDADSISYSLIHFLSFKVEGELFMPELEVVDIAINSYISTLYSEVGCSHIAAFLGGKGNFRYEIAKTKPYKGKRAEKTEFHCKWSQYINEYLVQKYGFQRVDGMEADDAVSITSIELTKKGINHVICSNDKDVDQVPGNHYSMSKRQFYHITKEQASLLLHTQYITGDTIDNIPGLAGKGKMYADKLLADKEVFQHWTSVAWAYEQYSKLEAPGWMIYLEEQKALLTLLTEHPSFIPEIELINKALPTPDLPEGL